MAVAISWKTVQQFLWLLLAAICLVCALVFWVLNNRHPDVVVIEPEQQAQEAVRPVKNETVAFDTQLGNFSTEVPMLALQQRVVARGDRAPEFRGSKFVSENTNAWAMQIMTVSEEDIIKSYLDKRDDRAKFQYFRLQSKDDTEQFVLTYGKFKDVNDALNKTKAMDFDLPEKMQPKPEKFSTYGSQINDLGYEEISTGLKLRPINLTRVALPVTLPRAPVNTTPATSTADTLAGGTTTTIKQTDQKTQQQNVRTENSRVPVVQEQKPTPPRVQPHEQQVVDPF